jgi:hypothetical protein
MDLIYTNAEHEDVGVLRYYELDLAFGSDENDFELVATSDKDVCEPSSLIYIEGTEYGGIIDSKSIDTSSDKLTYSGRSWHGILNSKIICPPAGEDYLIMGGEANLFINDIIQFVGLDDLFTASTADSDINIESYQFNRYTGAYDGLRKALKSAGAKLLFKFNGEKVKLSAAPIVDYSADEEFDSDQIALKVQKDYNRINHLICLGQGDLKDRQVVNLYADEDGNISQKQTFKGTDEYAEVYDYSSAESLEELTKSGISKLEEYQQEGSASGTLTADEGVEYDVGDLMGATEQLTGMSISAEITKKIVNISNGEITISYKIGD